jgi:serine/threonine protein kinase
VRHELNSSEFDSPEDERLYDLLAEWDEKRSLGHEPTPEELCPDDPVLRERLREKIAVQKGLDARLGLDHKGPAELDSGISEPLPQIPGIVIECEIGRGAMGVVYRGTQVALGRSVAVKVILSGTHATSTERERFRTEALATARLPHPNIVRVHDSGRAAGLPYLVLEYLEGGSLASRLRGEPQAPRWSAELVRTLAGAGAAAHAQGVVHRDLKPANILFAADETAKITDYGLAKLLDQDVALTMSGQSPGTPSYMAPEQAGLRPYSVSPATDVYALGAILYEMLTGRPPFRGVSVSETLEQVRTQDPVPPSRLQPKTPRDLETICLKCLEKDPARRYGSAQGLADDLGLFLDGRPISARRVGPLERVWRWCKRKPGLAASLASLALVTIVGFITITWLWTIARREQIAAEENLSQLTQTLDRYSGFANRTDLRSRELDAAREQALVEVRNELEKLDAKYHDNSRLQQSLIVGLIRVSEIEADLRQPEKAIVAIRKAIDRAEAFLREAPASVERRDLLVKALHRSLVDEMDFDRSTSAQRRATEILQTLIRDQPDKAAGYRQLQCMNDYNFAKRLLGAGRRPEATALFRDSRDLGEALLREGRGDSLLLRTVGRIDSFLGEIEKEDGQAQAAETSYCRSNELFRTVFEREPRNLDAILEYATSCEQVQNFYGNYDRVDDSTRYAKQICRVLRESAQGAGWRDEERIVLQKRLAHAYYMMEMQHGRNQQVFEKDPKRYEEEVAGLEANSRKVHEIVEAFRTLEATDEFLNYMDCMSCMNAYYILVEHHKNAAAAREWLVRAHSRLPADLSKEPEDRRGFYESIRATYEEKSKKPN